MLLQISEPDSGQVPQRERKRGLGIDLGTTNSLVAVKTASGVEVIKDATGEVLLPSVVLFGCRRRYYMDCLEDSLAVCGLF